jgi:hypothetical protein
MEDDVMKNWKTFLFACITAFFAFVLFDPQWFPPIIISIAKFGAAGGLVGLGLFAKDSNVTGGTTTQPTVANPPSIIEKR